MQRVFLFQKEDNELDGIHIDNVGKKILKEHLLTRKTASFEWYPDFDLCSFNWYDINSPETDTERILIYFSRKDLLVYCENADTQVRMTNFFGSENKNTERQLHDFLVGLLACDMDYIDNYEDLITDTEDIGISSHSQDYMLKIQEYRKELLRLKRYYTQLQVICDGLLDNANNLICEDGLIHFNIVHNRIDRCHAAVLNLQDYVMQMRETYQSQIDIEQNELMKVFTLITTLFLPLSLMVGWYGMNFHNMSELSSPWGYPVFIIVSIGISLGLILYFKKKKWF